MANALRMATPRRESSRSAPVYPMYRNRVTPPQIERQPRSVARLRPVPQRGMTDRSAQLPHLPTAPTLYSFPSTTTIPSWLRVLLQTHRASIVVAFVLVIAALVVYGSTVYTQQLWSKEYRKLKTLQRSERQFLAAGELIKNQITQQAEQPGSGLVARSTSNMIFLKPAPLRSQPAADSTAATNQAKPTSPKPLGY